MLGKEKDVIRRIALVVPKLSKDKQSYILGVAEGMAIAREDTKEKNKKNKAIDVANRKELKTKNREEYRL